MPLLLVGGLLALLAAGVHADRQDTLVFRSSVDLVDVDVSVLDRNRLPVRGLTAADFTVLEDDRPRPIVAFSAIDLPSRELPPARWMSTVAPDVVHNDLQHEGRLVVILVDQSIALEHLPAAQQIAESVVDQLRPGDLAAVAYSTFGVPQNFTADRERLLHAIRQPLIGLPADDGGGPATCPCGACSLETIGDIAEALAPVRQRRKLLVAIGSNIAIYSAGTCSARLNPARERAFRAVEAGNVTVHAFDPGGLPTLLAAASGRRPSGRGRAMANLARIGNLTTLPDHTGGRFIADPIRPGDRMAEVFRESDSYYVLGFEPAHSDDGRFHRIRLRVNRPGVTLQARRGYFGGPARTAGADGDEDSQTTSMPPRLRQAAAGLWPSSDIRLSVAAAPLARPDLSGAFVASVVHVMQDFGDRLPVLLDRPTTGDVRVFTGAFDRHGRALASSEQTLRVEPRAAGARRFEYEVVSRLDLKPGRYELRTAVDDGVLGRTGSVYTYVDVPDYRNTDVALSGLLIDVSPRGVVVPRESLTGMVPIVPTTRREFARTDEVRAFARIYQGVSRDLMPGFVVAEILDAADTLVYRQETRLVTGEFGASRAVDYTVHVPVARLPPGDYVLGIEARHGNEVARRDVRFSVH